VKFPELQQLFSEGKTQTIINKPPILHKTGPFCKKGVPETIE